ncbi:antirestriction protein ArdA [Alterisphingorhabdus coralli]|uniref:Antirestriction protein ArdA n=1 Tax=Alterisphingorhabdus coralli TaxID=3071408 RepID=A0AA97FC64_9SPHN|nr:antirestriction protein ArdA [Parasphingorhabdus sp. SCSIO 66989]WOE76360.1 antirestriction protein ArdA [Parasphingorhabdus sp. SCSIO 66989]
MTNRYFAQPYSDHEGFYFSDLEEYREKAAQLLKSHGVEEYEIQYIDGDKAELFEAVRPTQGDLSKWFETFEPMDEDDTIKAVYMAEYGGWKMADIPDELENVSLFEGTKLDYAYSLVDDCGMLSDVPDTVARYFDYDSYARDLVLGGDISEYRYGEQDYVIS